ncbi:MAG TPA: SUMF1/EgtB/PvdO family nonheme iron enzyme [Polyangiaceae bacterium]|nr:SUMF1/EgtB/PvdO family nonheme iron enzyme [Polyangiaceae bacterium]
MARWTVAIGAVAGASACSGAGPQLVVVVDTDAPVIGALAADAGLGKRSLAGAVDWVRIDVLEDDGGTGQEYEFPLPDEGDWPVSFGVSGAGGGPSSGVAHLRVRAFGAAFATPGELRGLPTRDPIPEVAIDRLVDIPFPSRGVERRRILLAADCMGRPASFEGSSTTCIDGASLRASASDGVAADDGAPSHVGQWAAARPVDCPVPKVAADAGRVCIRGGVSILGDVGLLGDSNGSTILESAPLVPVVLTPFWLDETEVTVATYRGLLAGGLAKGGAPRPFDPDASADASARYCTWTASAGPHEDLPVNCVDLVSARAVCRALGGDLPTEAQWEHAARGRGRQDTYPWGNDPPLTLAGGPACDRASYARASLSGSPPECGSGSDPTVEPVRSHPADRSPDGVFDLAGGVSEIVLDAPRSYSDPCWGGPGLRRDPSCVDPTATAAGSGVLRGGSFLEPSFFLQLAVRQSEGAPSSLPSPAVGFRCAYPAVAP